MKASEIQLIYTRPSHHRIKITTSQEVYDLIMQHWNLATIELFEEVKILLLNQAAEVLGLLKVAQGGISSASVDAKLVFGPVLKAAASSIILVHNHPSGNLKPSQQDIRLTNNLVKGAKYLDVKVLDHLIISNDGFYSFLDEKML